MPQPKLGAVRRDRLVGRATGLGRDCHARDQPAARDVEDKQQVLVEVIDVGQRTVRAEDNFRRAVPCLDAIHHLAAA